MVTALAPPPSYAASVSDVDAMRQLVLASEAAGVPTSIITELAFRAATEHETAPSVQPDEQHRHCCSRRLLGVDTGGWAAGAPSLDPSDSDGFGGDSHKYTFVLLTVKVDDITSLAGTIFHLNHCVSEIVFSTNVITT